MQSPTSNIAALDGLRGLCCLLVVLFHGSFFEPQYSVVWMQQAHICVMMFFCLSGFLMAYQYMPGALQLRYWFAYIVRRFFRVYPMYILFVLMFWVTYRVTGFSLFAFVPDSQSAVNHALFLEANFYFWTVQAETIFYIIFAFVGYGLLWLERLNIVTLKMLSLIWLALIIMAYHYPEISFYTKLSFFFTGSMAGYWYKMHGAHQLFPPYIWNVIALLAIGAFTISPTIISWKIYDYPWQNALFPGILLPVALLAIIKSSGWITPLFTTRPLRFLGAISYSLYLVHVYIMSHIYEWFSGHIVSGLAVLLVLSITTAWILHISIEKPLQLYGKKLSKKIMASTHA